LPLSRATPAACQDGGDICYQTTPDSLAAAPMISDASALAEPFQHERTLDACHDYATTRHTPRHRISMPLAPTSTLPAWFPPRATTARFGLSRQLRHQASTPRPLIDSFYARRAGKRRCRCRQALFANADATRHAPTYRAD